MKVWITKYALTNGIFVCDAVQSKEYPSMIKLRRSPTHHEEYFHGGDWHTSWGEALKQAEKMRANKLLSLEKQQKKLMNLEFTNPDKP